MKVKKVLSGKNNSTLTILYDEDFRIGSIALNDGGLPNIKYISKELYDLMMKELYNQKEK